MRKEYISPDATALELQSRGIVCQSLIDALAIDSGFESLNEETKLTW